MPEKVAVKIESVMTVFDELAEGRQISYVWILMSDSGVLGFTANVESERIRTMCKEVLMRLDLAATRPEA